jgi:hypothetical protein
MADKETPEIVNEAELDEATASAATLNPGAGSGGTESKAQTLATFTSLLAQLGKEDLSKLFNDVQSQYGPNKAPGAEDKSAGNKASIKAKPSAAVGTGEGSVDNPAQKLSVKEDVEEMFGAEELTEDFRERAEVIFEAALNTRLALETARLEEAFEAKVQEVEESYEAKLEETASSMFEEVTTKLDQYLDYVIEQWMEENKLAVEAQLRTEIAENFIQGLHNLFAEHYIRVPDEKIDLVAEMKSEVEVLKSELNKAINEKMELKSIIDEATKEATLEEVSEGLAETQVEKLRTLAEGIDYSNAETYRKKLEIVKENYFSGKKSAPTTGLITEEIDGDVELTEEKVVPASMAKYVQAISKVVK